MAISFQCQCGKKMNAKEDFAGRRLRCPECQRVVTIPRPGSSPVISPAETPTTGNTMTAAEVAALRKDLSDTHAPVRPKTLPAEDFGNWFNDETPTPPPTRSSAKPAAKPVPAVQPAAPKPAPTPTVTGPHPWIDQSMVQSPTSWQTGDEERYQADVRAAPEREFPMSWLGAAVIFGSLAALAFLS